MAAALYAVYEAFKLLKTIGTNTTEQNNLLKEKTIKNVSQWFEKLKNNVNSVGRGIGKLMDGSFINSNSGSNITAPENKYARVLELTADVQKKYESPNGKRGDGGKSFGHYQVQQRAARDVLGYTPTIQQLEDPAFNRMVRDKYLTLGLERANGNIAGALAFYNGGQGGLNQYNKTGRSYNSYAEKILNEVDLSSFKNTPSPAQMGNPSPANLTNNAKPQAESAPQQLSSNGAGSANNIVIHSLAVNANNPTEMMEQILINTAFPAAGGRLA